MDPIEKLANLGWRISSVGFQLLTENGVTASINTIVAKAVDTDIRDYGEHILSSQLKQTKTDKIILQIQKIKNVASPKSKEDSQFAPRMLKLILTDGCTTCPAIEISNLSFLSRSNTPPGSKILLQGAKIASGCILLQPNSCELIGGCVPALYEKWELVKNISQNLRSAGSDGPPPWVNFGEKIISSTSNESFKALAEKNTKESSNEFDLHRQDAISSATTGAVKKVFGGLKKPLPVNSNNKHFNGQEFNKPRHAKGFKGKASASDKVDKSQKPPEKVSLFDFLEDKLPANQVEEKNVQIRSSESYENKYNEYNGPQRYENKYNEYNRPQRYENKYNEYNRPQISSNVFSDQGPKFTRDSHTNIRPNRNNYTHQTQPVAKTSSSANYKVENIQNATYNKNEVTHHQSNELPRNMANLLLDTQFASKTLKQHLNLPPNKMSNKSNSSNTASVYNWKIGDTCRAKYWEDGKYYNAVVTNLTPNTCVVLFNGYGNVEEVLKADCIPFNVDNHATNNFVSNSQKKDSRGTREYFNNGKSSTSNRSANNYHKS